MRAQTFLRTVTVDPADLLERFLTLMRTEGIRFCVIGGQAVNAYVEPLVSLDLDVAVVADQLRAVEDALRRAFTVERFAHSLDVTVPNSDLRIQIQIDPRYADFVPRSSVREILGHEMPVAALEDVLQGKVWAVEDSARRPSKRQKDLADIARILEARPELRPLVPRAILERLV
jgi:Nucleotidyl transferase AbiEii toxin, Type IV TA system